MIKLSEAQLSDAENYLRWLNDEEVSRHLAVDPPKTLEEEIEWLKSTLSGTSSKLLNIISDDGKLIGNLGLHDLANEQKRFELGIVIGEKAYWNKGYGTEAVKEAVRYGFDVLGAQKIYLKVDIENLRAIKCYEKSGFKIVDTKKNSKGQEEYIMETL